MNIGELLAKQVQDTGGFLFTGSEEETRVTIDYGPPASGKTLQRMLSIADDRPLVITTNNNILSSYNGVYDYLKMNRKRLEAEYGADPIEKYGLRTTKRSQDPDNYIPTVLLQNQAVLTDPSVPIAKVAVATTWELLRKQIGIMYSDGFLDRMGIKAIYIDEWTHIAQGIADEFKATTLTDKGKENPFAVIKLVRELHSELSDMATLFNVNVYLSCHTALGKIKASTGAWEPTGPATATGMSLKQLHHEIGTILYRRVEEVELPEVAQDIVAKSPTYEIFRDDPAEIIAREKKWPAAFRYWQTVTRQKPATIPGMAAYEESIAKTREISWVPYETASLTQMRARAGKKYPGVSLE